MKLKPLLRLIVQFCLALCWLGMVVSADKWVWGNNRGRDGLRGEHSIARPYVNTNVETSSASAPLFQSAIKKPKLLQSPQSDDPDGDLRYQVFENGNGPGGPNDLPPRPPIRPPTQYEGPRPGPPGNGNFNPSPLPPRPPRPSGLPPPLPPRPGSQGANLGVLTGPVPSWELPLSDKNKDPTRFDTCNCVNSFNCKSPGLKFGSCDVGKSYCCHNSPGYGIQPSGAPPSFGNKDPGGPAVLAGPNGPVDGLRPDFLAHLGPPFLDGSDFNRPPPPPGLSPLPFDNFQPRSANRDKPRDRKL